MVEGGLSADVIAYTTTQGYGVVVVQPVRLCASKKKKNASLPLGCYQCSASGEAVVCSSSFGVRMGAQRAGPHVQAFSCSRIDD
jgi:hypothetical protein